MRPFPILFSLLIGGLALWSEFRSVKESALFTGWFNSAPFWLLCALTIIFLIINYRLYSSNKKLTSFIPLLLCAVSLSLVIGRQKKMETLDNSPTEFTATTFDIGTDGGLVLDFKENGHVKAEKRDHWIVTYYWGTYSKSNDTINLDIPFDFTISRQALLTKDSLHFVNESARFIVLSTNAKF